ncbi:DUF3159 domain-containing protein [Nocardia sp. SYP-A9097]|uniref:DUF3159 domain-containing protein n=1 Tax=Nocardia sp. SYP-A9097 TaxID=2663237 RepID=UPI0018912916|nr:DUF3159 domain-containing protein [Nocardia sp. SYP-A9097]
MTIPPPHEPPTTTTPSGVPELRAKLRDLGGARHLIDGAAPILGYIIGFQLRGIATGIAAAIATAAMIALLRIRHGDRSKVVAASTLLVLVFSAMAAVTGEGRDFFLPPLILYSGLTIGFGISLLTSTPLTLPICQRIRFEPATPADPATRITLHRRVTTAWMIFCAAHVLIMGPVYLADNVVLLGTLALILNKPALLAALAGTWVWLRRTSRTSLRRI